MSLNIKNDETCRLVGELARLTGETMTGAITWSVKDAGAARMLWLGSFTPSDSATPVSWAGAFGRGAWRSALR